MEEKVKVYVRIEQPIFQLLNIMERLVMVEQMTEQAKQHYVIYQEPRE